MTYYDEFPLSTVIYNWTVVGGLVGLGIAVAAQVGVGLLLGYAVSHSRLVCSHCRQGVCGDCPLGQRFGEGGRE